MSRPTKHVDYLTLTPTEWDEIRDALILALDALGDGPAQVDRNFLVNLMGNQRIALQITHRRAERLGIAFALPQKNLSPAKGVRAHG